MTMQKIAPDQIDRKMTEFPDWSLTSGKIARTFGFEDFPAAMTFVNRVADLAERLHHHPDFMIRGSKVTLTVTTHDAGGITEKDLTFAREVDALIDPQPATR